MGRGLAGSLFFLGYVLSQMAIEVRDLRTEVSPGEGMRDIKSGGLSSPPDATVGLLVGGVLDIILGAGESENSTDEIAIF